MGIQITSGLHPKAAIVHARYTVFQMVEVAVVGYTD